MGIACTVKSFDTIKQYLKCTTGHCNYHCLICTTAQLKSQMERLFFGKRVTVTSQLWVSQLTGKIDCNLHSLILLLHKDIKISNIIVVITTIQLSNG